MDPSLSISICAFLAAALSALWTRRQAKASEKALILQQEAEERMKEMDKRAAVRFEAQMMPDGEAVVLRNEGHSPVFIFEARLSRGGQSWDVLGGGQPLKDHAQLILSSHSVNPRRGDKVQVDWNRGIGQGNPIEKWVTQLT